MSRFTAILHRIFGGTTRIIVEIGGQVVTPAYREILRRGVTTDAERRQIVEDHVADYISRKYPNYGWLLAKAVDIVFDVVRARLKERGQ